MNLHPINRLIALMFATSIILIVCDKAASQSRRDEQPALQQSYAHIRIPKRMGDYSEFIAAADSILGNSSAIQSRDTADLALAYYTICTSSGPGQTQDLSRCLNEERIVASAKNFYISQNDKIGLSILSWIEGVNFRSQNDLFRAKISYEAAYNELRSADLKAASRDRTFLLVPLHFFPLDSSRALLSALAVVYAALGDLESFDRTIKPTDGMESWRNLLLFQNALRTNNFQEAQRLAAGSLDNVSGGFIGLAKLAQVAMLQGDLETANRYLMRIYRIQLGLKENGEHWDIAALAKALEAQGERRFDVTWFNFHIPILIRQARFSDAMWMSCEKHRRQKKFRERSKFISRGGLKQYEAASACIKWSVLLGAVEANLSEATNPANK